MEISEELWTDMKKNTLAGVMRLLESAEKLLSNNGDPAICAGLYTYAVEEYGKLIMLNKCILVDGNIDINEKQLFGGHRSHELKFEAAIAELPDECKHIGVDYWAGYYPKGYWGGYFPDEGSVVADFESRKAIFYCGLDKSNKAIKHVPLVGKKSLGKAIENLKTIVLGR